MSTFGGFIPEFPEIRVDYFRPIPDRPPPLKCFLSHVHTDHLKGLEGFTRCFVYCSAATKELLIRREKKVNRVNFETGVTEARKCDYRQLEPRLKTIPLETPTRIELNPDNEIQVTLFDANHCPGAVMFLFEGDGKAVLYTGDIRSEPWFVNNLTRSPFLIEYTSGMKTLDCIYLDTSNTDPRNFSSKAEGLRELVRKVSEYPDDTVFHFSAWTFGYEEVWMALSRTLKSQIHVDKYTMRLYKALSGKICTKEKPVPSGPFLSYEGPVLTGYMCGNTPQEGCLTEVPNVRIHSCIKQMACPLLKGNEKVVWIRPVVTRLKDGTEIAEIGIGGGGEDLKEEDEFELDDDSIFEVINLIEHSELPNKSTLTLRFLNGIRSLGRALPRETIVQFVEDGTASPLELIEAIEKTVSAKESAVTSEVPKGSELPRNITFPFSRHSSYTELCDLVRIFQPKDVYQCTVDEETWTEDVSVRHLFGHECSGKVFRHDIEISKNQARRLEERQHTISQQTHTTTASSPISPDRARQRTSLSSLSPAGKVPRRTSNGKLRLFNIQGGEVLPSSQPPSPDLGTFARNRQIGASASQPISLSSPPRVLNFLASSPGSVSQGLRRKYIGDAVEDGLTKRQRLAVDDLESSPSGLRNFGFATKADFAKGEKSLEPFKEIDPQTFPGLNAIFRPQARSEVVTTAATLSTNVLGDSSKSVFEEREDLTAGDKQISGENSPILGRETRSRLHDDSTTLVGTEIQIESESGDSSQPDTPGSGTDTDIDEISSEPTEAKPLTLNEVWEDHYYLSEVSYFDDLDNIVRCNECHHEIWTGYQGFCGGCSATEDEHANNIPYHEVLEPGEAPSVEATLDDETYLGDVLETYLDYDSSAYDSQDEAENFREEYEVNSFIDDSPANDTDDEEEQNSSGDEEIDWEAKFRALAAAHTALAGAYDDLDEKYHGYRQLIEGSDYRSTDDSEIDDMDEADFHIVNPTVQDPVVTELVLSQSRDNSSQGHELSAERVRDRVEAFEAVSANASGWHTVSLASIADSA